jgi:glycosyltransferase involved in cell wall biosynthesis
VTPSVDSVSVFFPCFNDAETIGWVLERAEVTLRKLGLDHELIVVDDGSSDGSPAAIASFSRRLAPVRVVSHEVNIGYGGALISGFAAARCDWVFYTDGDGQFDPAELEALVAHAGPGVDVVQGFKLSRSDSAHRRLAGVAYTAAVRHAMGLWIRDVDCDFRLIRRSVLERVSLTRRSGAICVELVRGLQDAGARFVEVPIHHRPRRAGRSQFFRPIPVARTLVDVTEMWWRLRRDARPEDLRGEHDGRDADREVDATEEAAFRR